MYLINCKLRILKIYIEIISFFPLFKLKIDLISLFNSEKFGNIVQFISIFVGKLYIY